MTFKITDHIEFDSSLRAICPSCAADGKTKKRNLAIVPDSDGAYKCHRGCSPEDIRQALGQAKSKPVPTALQPKVPPKKTQVPPQKVKADHDRLMDSDGPAKKWLSDRGIDEAIATQHKLGIVRVKVANANHWAISIPIPAAGGTTYHLKKRVEPWDEQTRALDGYQPWKQYGIPQMVWFTHLPDDAQETWLCEGEWDAMKLAALVRETDRQIAIACFTCGCSNVPAADELVKLPGKVTIFYDRNDTPLKNGTVPGDAGAEKAALAIGDRGRIGAVPMPDGCKVKGWDVSDAINKGFALDDFVSAAAHALKPDPKAKSSNSLRRSLIWNDDLISNAPDYTEFLVPDLLTEDELFLFAASPRAGKSLMAMTLAKAVASGDQFLGRPCTQGTVIYVKCEDSHTKIKEREAAQGWGKGLPVAWLDDFRLSNMSELVELVEELDPRLIVLDTLSRIKDSTISESSAEMSQLLDPLQKMANKYGCCVVLVHHTGKVSTDNIDKVDIFDTIRGSSAIRAVCRGSMVLAAGDRDYRLVVENGWGKHDLKVVLDANTLTWKQLGKWSPPVNMSQQDQILDALKKMESASVEQLHDETGIAKKSLYEQLSRLVNKDAEGPQVVKEGSKRKYTYRLAIFNTIQQLNSVLNSENSDGQSDRGYSQQDLYSGGNNLSPEISTTSTVPVEVVEIFEQGVPPTTCPAVDYSLQTAPAIESYNQHAIQHPQSCGLSSTTDKPDNLSNDVTVENGGGRNEFKPGDRVYYTGGNMARFRVCGRKKLTIESIADGIAVVSHPKWLVTQSIDVTEMEPAK